MCGPAAIPLAMMAVSFAATAATAVTANQAQNSEASAQANQNTLNQSNISQNLRDQYQQGTQQLVYHNEQAAQQDLENQRKTRAAEGTALDSADGIQGPSVGAVYNEYQGNASQYASDVAWNKNASDEEITQQMQGFQSEAQNKINNLPVPNYASNTGTALSILGAGASGAAKGYMYENPSAGPGASSN